MTGVSLESQRGGGGGCRQSSRSMPPWLAMLLALGWVHTAPLPPSSEKSADNIVLTFPEKSLDSSPILYNSVSDKTLDLLSFGEDLLPPKNVTTIQLDESFLSLNDSELIQIGKSEVNMETNDYELLPAAPGGLVEFKADKWWCGNNSFSRGLAHIIARLDDNMPEMMRSLGINECCRVHDHEYDEARTFLEVALADTRFDECLGRETSTYRNYVVRPLYNTAIGMNYGFEKLKSAFKTAFFGGDGYLDLR